MRDMPESIWPAVLASAKGLRLLETGPATFEQVLRQHLFHNASIVDHNDQPLGSKAMRNAAANGISHVRDLLDQDGNIRTEADLRLSTITYDRIINALPVRWKQLIHDGPAPPSVGEWFARDCAVPTARVLRVHAIDNGVVHLHVFAANDDGTFNKDNFVVEQHTFLAFSAVRAHVTEHREGFLCHGPQQLLELDPALLQVDQRIGATTTRVPLLKATVNGSSKQLTAAVAELPTFSGWQHLTHTKPIRWRRIISWVWMPHRDNTIKAWLWRLLHRSLAIGFNRRRFADDVDCACDLSMETIEHLFNECAVFEAVWQWFRSAWHDATRMPLGNSLYDRLFCSVPVKSGAYKKKQHTRMYWTLLAIAHPILLHSLWLQRCDAVMGGNPQAFTAVSVAARFRQRLLVAIPPLMDLARYDGLQAWADDLIGAIDTLPASLLTATSTPLSTSTPSSTSTTDSESEE
jgi:hypothetical protein